MFRSECTAWALAWAELARNLALPFSPITQENKRRDGPLRFMALSGEIHACGNSANALMDDPLSIVPLPAPSPERLSFFDDFRRFFQRGLAAILPTLITLWLLVWVWDFLWNNVGSHIMQGIRWIWWVSSQQGFIPTIPPGLILRRLNDDDFSTRLLGVVLSILLIYVVGVFVGNLLGRTAWRIAEIAVMKIPLVRAIYPAVKQVTDFLLSERTAQFQGSKVVAVEPHEKGIWSIGLVTGEGLSPLSEATGQKMITVFVPSSPTAFSGYVLVVPRESVVELPLKVEEAMRLLVSGGVISPDTNKKLVDEMRFPSSKAVMPVKQPPAA